MHSQQPVVSVIVPVYNTAPYLRESLNCLTAQSLDAIEIICVNDGSTDGSAEMLREYAGRDSRIKVIDQDNAGAGAARNRGFLEAKGEFIYFFDSDDLCDSQLLEKTVKKAHASNADIVVFDYERLYKDGSRSYNSSIHPGFLSEEKDIFNYRDCPDRIMNITNPAPWNKLYRAEFIRSHRLRFDEISSSNDLSFTCVSVALAGVIAVLSEALTTYRVAAAGSISVKRNSSIGNTLTAVLSAVRQAEQIPYYAEIQSAVTYFCMEILTYSIFELMRKDYSPEAEQYYTAVHSFFREDRFAGLVRTQFSYEILYLRFRVVQVHDYKTFLQLRSRRLVVSLTSSRERIWLVPSVLESIYQQKYPADRIVLWLPEEKFPDRIADLPGKLQNLSESGRLTIRWCKDMGAHTNCWYALQTYSDEIVVTIDDNRKYAPYLLERLYLSYLLFPDAVSGAQCHLLAMTPEGRLLPAEYWGNRMDCYYEPSMSLVAVDYAGILYPPHLLDAELLGLMMKGDGESRRNNDADFSGKDSQKIPVCREPDSLLKVVEVMSNVPVVAIRYDREIQYIDGYKPDNDKTCGVDKSVSVNLEFEQVLQWTSDRFGEGYLDRKIMEAHLSVGGTCLIIPKYLIDVYERRKNRQSLHEREKDQEIRRLRKEIREKEAGIKKIRNSTSFRLGKSLTWLPRKLKNILKKRSF